MARLNDTEALVRQGTKQPQLETADGCKHFSPSDDATAAVVGHRPGRFQRNVGAGDSSLAAAVASLGEES